MKYKVGDKVRVRDDLETYRMYGKYEFDYSMNKYKGKEAIIELVSDTFYDLSIDGGKNYWTDEMLEPLTHMPNKFKGYPIAENIAESDENTDEVVDTSVETIDKNGQKDKKSTVKIGQFTKENFKFGDIVTLRNGEQGIISGEKIVYPNEKFDFIKEFNNDFKYLGENKKFDIMKVQRLCQYEEGQFKVIDVFRYKTLYERKEEILTEKEKEYLSGVIRPFRYRKFTISKIQTYDKKSEFIFIEFSEDEYMAFPYFDKGTMYKNMEIRKEYTLEELGL